MNDTSTLPRCPPGTPFSFELYPPRSAQAAQALPATIDALAATRPEFMSVTYGAGGASRTSSLEVLCYIREQTGVPAMAHLTCVGSSHQEAGRLIRDFLDAGITSFLAVRGDKPPDAAADVLGDLGSAAELVQLIHRMQAERIPYREVSLPGLAGKRVRTDRDRVRIAVAAFPNGHPRSRSVSQDIDTLLAKQAAGANLAITQLFFHPHDYLTFAQAAVEAGVTMPIVPGIMPVTSAGRLRRMLELSGEDLPAELSIRLEVEPTEDGRRAIGISHAIGLCTELVASGAPGIHLYTFNQHETALAVLAGCGLLAADQAHTQKEPA